MAEIKMGGWIEDKDALASFLAKKSTGTWLNSKMIAETWDDEAKSKAFFSSRVTDADILEGIRRQVARVVSGEIGQSDARFWIRKFLESKGDAVLQDMGFLPHEEAKDAGLTELGSTSRLDLIIEQNVRMAQAARKYQELTEEKDSFPYVQYHTKEDAKVRNSHRLLDKKIFRVDDPMLRHIMPPQDFRCRCWLTRLSADEVDPDEVSNGLPKGWKPPQSGYSFDPETWMNQGLEAKEQWGDDLKQAFLEDTSQHAESEAAFLLKRRAFWAKELSGEDPATSEDAIKRIDERIAAIRAQQTRPTAKAREKTIEDLDAALAKAETEMRNSQNTPQVMPPSFLKKLEKVVKPANSSDPFDTARRTAEIEDLRKLDASTAKALLKIHKSLGDKLEIHSFKDSIVQENIRHLSKLPPKLLDRLKKTWFSTIMIDAKAVPEFQGLEHLKGVRPRNWPGGTTWDQVPGCYNSSNRTVYAGTKGKHGSASLILHETGHAFGDAFGLDYSQELINHHQRLHSKLSEYQQFDGPGGKAGREEMLAEAIAVLTMQGYAKAKLKYDKNFIDWLKKELGL